MKLLKRILIIVVALVLVSSAVDFRSLAAGDNAPVEFSDWFLRSPDHMNGSCIAYGNGLYVSVGSYGAVQVSADTVSWAYRPALTNQSFNGIAYGNNVFVATASSKIGADNTNCILTSSDTWNWTKKELDTKSNIVGVAFGSGVFCACVTGYNNNHILLSQDGKSWSVAAQLDTNSTINALTYGNGMFIAVGDGSIIYTSTDGSNWTKHNFNVYNGAHLFHIAAGNGVFVVDFFGSIYVSSDCDSWHDKWSNSDNTQSLQYVNNAFYMTRETGSIYRSGDGVKWEKIKLKTLDDYNPIISISYGNGVFFALAETYTFLSNNGRDWVLYDKGNTANAIYSSAAYGNGIYLATGPVSDFITAKHGESAVSKDGINWSLKNHGDMMLGDVAFGNGVFVAIEMDNSSAWPLEKVAVTTNGADWNYYTLPEKRTGSINNLIFSNGIFVAAGQDHSSKNGSGTAFIEVSSDGVKWKRVLQLPDIASESILYACGGNGSLIATDRYSTNYYYSTDGINWVQKQTSEISGKSIYANGAYYIYDFRDIWISKDGVSWTKYNVVITSSEKATIGDFNEKSFTRIYQAVYGNGYFVALGEYQGVPELFTSFDGINWSVCTSGTEKTPRQLLGRVYYLNDSFYMIDGCRIIQLGAKSAATSVPTTITGNTTTLSAYAIGGNNFLKLRDLATLLNGTAKQYSVSYDAGTGVVGISRGAAYTPVGGELTPSAKYDGAIVSPSAVKILVDGKETIFTAYNFGGNYYFKLRDLAATLNFGVTWDGTTNTIGIDPSIGYTA
jgi:photosystem II stability/assembly factor-like uncharacterized protein